MTKARWILASLLLACGFEDNDQNVIPIDASSGESGTPEPTLCGNLECGDHEVCVEDEPLDGDEADATHRCVSTAGCSAMPADCTCVEPVCTEGRECVGVGLVPGQQFQCALPEGSTGG